MVSKASEDFPDPDTPVTTVRELWGISKSMFLRLWTRAPRTTMLSVDIAKGPIAPPPRLPPDCSARQATAEGVGNLSIISHDPKRPPATLPGGHRDLSGQRLSCRKRPKRKHAGNSARTSWRPNARKQEGPDFSEPDPTQGAALMEC